MTEMDVQKCKHKHWDAYPSSIPRIGWPFDVTCRNCKEKIGQCEWIETDWVTFELLFRPQWLQDFIDERDNKKVEGCNLRPRFMYYLPHEELIIKVITVTKNKLEYEAPIGHKFEIPINLDDALELGTLF